MEYTIAKKHPLIGQANILPTCDQLPPIGTKDGDNCIRLGIPNTVQIQHGNDKSNNCIYISLILIYYFQNTHVSMVTVKITEEQHQEQLMELNVVIGVIKYSFEHLIIQN